MPMLVNVTIHLNIEPEVTSFTHVIDNYDSAQKFKNQCKGKGKIFPYSLPSVGPGADPGVQAVSPQVT